MKKHMDNTPEFSRPLRVDRIPAGGIREHLVARPAERQAVAERFGLLEIALLEAHLDADHETGGIIKVTGEMRAEITQSCVVSLAPIKSSIREPIDTLFTPPVLATAGAKPPHEAHENIEEIEPIINGIIDLGELVCQHLAMAMDPYPRTNEATPPQASDTESGKPPASSPFAALSDMLKKT